MGPMSAPSRARRQHWHLARAGATLTLGIAASVPRSASAQSDSIASIGFEAYPYAKRGGREQIATSALRVNAGVPLFLSKQALLIPSVAYEYFEARLRDSSDARSIVAHAPSASLMSIVFLGKRFQVMMRTTLGMASDFKKSLSWNDVAASGLAMVSYRFSDSFTLGAGVLYDRRSGSPQPAPLLYINWQFADQWRLRGPVPASLALQYRVRPWLWSSVGATFVGNRFNIDADTYGRPKLYVAYSNVSVGPSLVLSAGEYLHLELYGALPVYRRFDTYLEHDKLDSVTLSPSLSYGIRFWIGPSFWQKRGERPRPP
ncbi:Hypothetical protein A7982_07856 [Minicystis rosea]|nr:Hypothetical protein A7982_07856 [Minicystis rosea]